MTYGEFFQMIIATVAVINFYITIRNSHKKK